MFGTAVFEEFSLWAFHHGDLKLVFCSPQTGTQMGPLLKKILAPTRARLVVAFWIWPTGPWAALLGASFFPLPVTWPQGPLGYKAGAWCGICPRAGWCVSILSKKNFGSLGCECWLIFCWCPPRRSPSLEVVPFTVRIPGSPGVMVFMPVLDYQRVNPMISHKPIYKGSVAYSPINLMDVESLS